MARTNGTSRQRSLGQPERGTRGTRKAVPPPIATLQRRKELIAFGW
ncbi:MAG TPA: hypothetical protein VNL77_12015 [Roseiflexaceae bacterium]|nr:hypothetical protein [Roseiflexaceae bacterium]